MDLAEVTEEVRNPGHPSCRRKVGTQSPPSPLASCTDSLCQAQPGPVLLHFIPLILYPHWGTGEEAPAGSMEEPTGKRMGITPQHSDVPCDCLV